MKLNKITLFIGGFCMILGGLINQELRHAYRAGGLVLIWIALSVEDEK